MPWPDATRIQIPLLWPAHPQKRRKLGQAPGRSVSVAVGDHGGARPGAPRHALDGRVLRRPLCRAGSAAAIARGLSLPAGGAPQPPLEPFTLGGGLCAVLRHQGPYATMRAAYQWLYGQWLVQSGCEAADSPVFEEHLNNPRDTPTAQLLSDIYLPLA